ncbi:MAG: hypothetical protein M3N50_11050 [Pseudomonadota bacterium]|nr:hypothetical protein [Pseudomonadota bacterium]
MSSLGKLFAKRPAAPRKDSRPFTRRLSRYEPRVFRDEDHADLAPTDVVPQYKPPSVLAEHKIIVVIFGILCIGLAAYWIKSVRSAPKSAAQSVYIEMLPAEKPP